MIVGAGVEQVPAYEAAKKRGLIIVGTDMDSYAPGFDLADYKILVSTRDADATEKAALKFHQEHPVHGVMTIANDVPFTVARVAHSLALPSISLEAATCVTDKLLMKERFVAEGVPCPWFARVDTEQQGQRKPDGGPRQRFGEFDDVCAAVEDAEVEREEDEDAADKSRPVPRGDGGCGGHGFRS